MGEIYRSPLRVYLVLALLALWGIFSGLNLPISLFPNSEKPTIAVTIPYGDLTAEEFSRTYGTYIEFQIQGLLVEGRKVEILKANYRSKDVRYTVEFEWNTPGERALREVQTLMAGLSAGWPEEARRGYGVSQWSENSGFFALSFYSPVRSLTAVYDDLKPLVEPIAAKVPDATGVNLYNPDFKQIEITMSPERLASLHVFPNDVENAVRAFNSSLSGGRLQVGESKISIEFPRELDSVEKLRNLPLLNRAKVRLQLKDVAEVTLASSETSMQSFKTSGAPSLILFANPKPGSNVKKMADDIMAEIHRIRPQIPEDIEFKVLVNPSEFIDSSIKSVVKEVGLAAFLAVIILLLFIGSFKNVATAAIEIPMSIILAFILMKIFNVNLNLISLGGLALSAGMNVDASVVVMENIFRHFEKAPPNLSQEGRLKILLNAVREVWGPILASTVASLVVFIPLIMTTGLTNSLLGDLAKAVVFSHAMSAIVALILVPTVRLQMMKSETHFHLQSPIEKQFGWLENTYAKLLGSFIRSLRARLIVYGGVVITLIALFAFVLPSLPKEIIGRPETDWVMLGASSRTFSKSRQMEAYTEKMEFDLLEKHGDQISYLFTQITGPNNGWIMARLKDKKNMDKLWKGLEEEYVNTPEISYWVEPWNPSELPIPNPPHLRLELRGDTPEKRVQVAEDIRNLIQESQVFPRVRTEPDSTTDEQIIMRPYFDVLANMQQPVGLSDLASFVRVATEGKNIGSLSFGTSTYSMNLRMTPNRIRNIEELAGLPIGLQDKIVPLSALAHVELQKEPPGLFRYNQTNLLLLTARENESNKTAVPQKQAETKKLLADWDQKNPNSKVSVTWTDPDTEIQEALRQLKWALALSILLIFVTMVIQFGDLVSALLVLAAIPLGMIGVLASLFIFKSTLSLNSVLGMILLNGIAVANSIILVDFMQKLVAEGRAPLEAAVEASRARLRPILMTSLTTILGMIPIALGFGEGGRILQPLGIAVAGGLWISMLLTIFIVPALQATWLNRRSKKVISNVAWTETHQELR